MRVAIHAMLSSRSDTANLLEWLTQLSGTIAGMPEIVQLSTVDLERSVRRRGWMPEATRDPAKGFLSRKILDQDQLQFDIRRGGRAAEGAPLLRE